MPTDKEKNDQIKKICETYPTSYSTIIKMKARMEPLHKYIMASTAKFKDLPFPARIYYTLNGLDSYVKCKICGKDIPHDRKCSAISGYASLCCCHSCAQKDPIHREHVRMLSLKKYGTESPQASKQCRAKMKATLASKPQSHWDRSSEKRKMTCREKYGVDYVSQVPEIAKKTSESMLARSDEDEASRQAKSRTTKLKRYGDETYSNRALAAETRKRHRSENPDYQTEINAKRKQTVQTKYGVSHVCMLEKTKESHRKAVCRKRYERFAANNPDAEPLFSVEELAADPHGKQKWRCRKCGRVFEYAMFEHQGYAASCMKCNPMRPSDSAGQKELAEFVKSIYAGEICSEERGVIGRKELDVYLPGKALAFEYDGLYFHSEFFQPEPSYHVDKTEKCEALGIRLVHVFENEWLEKANIVKSRISDMLGVYGKTVYARKLTVRDVPPAATTEFLNVNHLQGATGSHARLGLYDGDDLISLMTFGRCRFSKKCEWELIRFCNRLGYHVPGAAGKLLKAFERKYNPKSLLSYADRRWSQGKLYETLGFRLDHKSAPNYWYWRHSTCAKEIESRVKYQKHKLPKLLEKFDPNKSEHDNMLANGYYRIYDCGNLVYVKDYT